MSGDFAPRPHRGRYIKAPNAGRDDHFGNALTLCGDTLAVGALGEDSCSTSVSGTAATDNGGAWAGAVDADIDLDEYVNAAAGVFVSPRRAPGGGISQRCGLSNSTHAQAPEDDDVSLQGSRQDSEGSEASFGRLFGAVPLGAEEAVRRKWACLVRGL